MIGSKEEGELPRRHKNEPRTKPVYGLVVAYVLALAFLCANFAVSFNNTETLIKNYGTQSRAFELRHSINQLYGGITEAELRERSYIISGSPADFDAYHSTRIRVQALLAQLRTDIEAVPNEGAAFDRLDRLIESRFISLGQRVQLRRERGREAAAKLVREQQITSEMPEIRRIVDQVTVDQRGQIDQVLAVVNRSSTRARYALWISGVASILTCGAVWLLLTNAELEAFAYSVSHDLRSPLRALGAMTATLKEEIKPNDEAALRETLERMQLTIRQMANRMEDLLRLSQVSRNEIQRSRVNLSDIVKQMARTLDERQPLRKTHWEIHEDLTVQADPRLMEIVLDNLMSNAWKFTSKVEHPTIEVGSQNGQIYIRDNGAGFDLPKDNNPFRPFRRFHSQEEFEGTGLGLAIVQRVISRHDGEIRVESSPGKGATVWFSLE